MAGRRIAAISLAVITGVMLAAPAGDALAVGSHVSSAGPALSAPAGPRAAPSPTGGTWGLAQPVTGATAAGSYPNGVDSLSCAAAGNCGAIGRDTDRSGASTMFVVSESDGVWGASQGVRGPANLVDGFGDDAHISCASPGNCTAVGDYYAGGEDEQGFVDNQTNGSWAVAQEVPGVTALAAGEHSVLGSVSCASAGNCSAGGTDTTAASGSAFLVDETDGAWGSAFEVPGITSLADGVTASSISSVSCGSTGNCTAVGTFGGAHDGAFVASETDGTWADAELVPGQYALSAANGVSITSVSCTSAGNCSAGGFYSATDGRSVAEQAFVVDEAGGSWGDAEEVPGIAALNIDGIARTTSVSCASAGNCAAGGVYFTSPQTDQAFVVDETAGTWATAITVPGLGNGYAVVNSISCGSAGNCAVGGFTGHSPTAAFVADETNGNWGAAEGVPGSASLGVGNGAQLASVSCTSAGYCSACGSYWAYGPPVSPFETEKPFVVNEATASATALTLITTAAAYGNEASAGASVAVTAADGGTPSGTVSVSAGPVIVCTATLGAGSGDCAFGNLTLPAGSYQLTATYSGDLTYVSSVSAGDTLTVSKARSMTSVSHSRAKVRYGHESLEKLSVTVAAEYAGVPAGRVVVRAGGSTICVMTLRLGRGACMFSARQLRAGKYHLTVIYAGDRNFDGSAESDMLIVVGK